MNLVLLKRIIIVIVTFNLLFLTIEAQCVQKDDTAPLEQLDFANGLFQRGLYDMGIKEYKKFLEVFPESEYRGEAYFGIAESLFFLKQYKNALNEYTRYVQDFPIGEKVALASLRIGQTYFFLKQFDEAIEYFSKIDQKLLDDRFKQILYFYTAKSYKALGKKEETLAYFDKTVKISNDSEYTNHAFFEMGDILAGSSEYDKAVEFYGRAYEGAQPQTVKSLALHKRGEMQFASGDYPASADTFKKVVEEYSGEDIALSALANLLLSLFNMAQYDTLIAQYEANAGLVTDDEKSFDVYYVVSLGYLELKRYDEALSHLNKLLSFDWLKDKERRKVFVKKSEVLLKTMRFKEAADLINTELSDSKDNADYITFMKGESSYGLGNFKEAIILYNQIIDEFPQSTFRDGSLYGIAYSQKSLGEDKEAVTSFIRYFEEGKNSSKRQEALYNAIVIETKLGHTRNAIKHSKLFLDTFEEGGLREKVFFRLGFLYSQLKDYYNAADTFKQFIRFYEESDKLEDAYFHAAYNLQLSEDFDGAIEYYNKITPDRDRTKFYSSLENIALIYINKGDNTNAAKTFDRIITESDDNNLGIEVYLWLSKHYLDTKDFNGALHILEKTQIKKNAEKHSKEIAYFRAEAYRQLEDYEKALTNYNIVLHEKGEDIFQGAAYIGKGLCYAYVKDFDRAKAEFEQALLEYPDDNTITMRARFEIANIENLKGNHEEACKLYMLVAVLYEDPYYCPEALLKAGELFKVLGKNEDAKKAYQEIVDRYPESDGYKTAKERLNVFDKD